MCRENFARISENLYFAARKSGGGLGGGGGGKKGGGGLLLMALMMGKHSWMWLHKEMIMRKRSLHIIYVSAY